MTRNTIPSASDGYRGERRAAALSLGVGVALMATKFGAYLLTGSSAVFSDALESIVNVLASAFALYAIVVAHTPADRSHPYGHGKIEFLAAGFEGGMILLAAMVIGYRAVEAMVVGPQVKQVGAGLALVAAAMLVNGGLGLYLVAHGRRSGSITLEADGKHLLSDAVTSVAVLATLGLVKFTGWTVLDPICAALVAVYLSVTAIGLLGRSAAGLMDKQDVDDDRLLRQILDAHVGPDAKEPTVCGYHKLRHRHSGRYHWVDFHLVVPSDWSITRGHDCASAIEHEIEAALGDADATAHVEPCRGEECVACGE